MLQNILNVLGPVLGALAGKYGVVVQILSLVGTLRLVMKPIVTAAQAITAATPTTKDDAVVAEVVASKWYKGLSFVLDYLASIKLPAAK